MLLEKILEEDSSVDDYTRHSNNSKCHNDKKHLLGNGVHHPGSVHVTNI